MKTFRIGGVHPAENKLSAGKAIETLALPKQAVFPLSQHIGAPATAIVKKGDVVKVGTKIAEAGGFVSAAIFSSVSGKVNKVDSVNRLFLLMWKVTNGKKASTAAANW